MVMCADVADEVYAKPHSALHVKESRCVNPDRAKNANSYSRYADYHKILVLSAEETGARRVSSDTVTLNSDPSVGLGAGNFDSLHEQGAFFVNWVKYSDHDFMSDKNGQLLIDHRK
eukprot:SAG11_NODE_1141_length_5707_cov_14.979315_9_plen_116_part_00